MASESFAMWIFCLVEIAFGLSVGAALTYLILLIHTWVTDER